MPAIAKPPAHDNIRHIIAVASGKGGVGKSTVAVNLALAMSSIGVRSGLLDADIYGPSQPLMVGVPESQRLETRPPDRIVPMEAHGLQTMSMGYLVTEQTPMVWRGPMVSSAFQQLFAKTLWRDLDCLVIDLPPGTGDIQLTLSQKIPVSGVVIVTTPQDIALLDARKGIEMFRKVGVETLGVVENMAYHECAECGHIEHVFGQRGGEEIARTYGVELLGSLPLRMSIREQTDSGKPALVAEPEGDIALAFKAMARRLAELLAKFEPPRDKKTDGKIPAVQIHSP